MATKKATKKAKANPVDDNDCSLQIGMRVYAQWSDNGKDYEKGDWYEGVAQNIDYVERTVDILFDDGDTDPAVPWKYARILD